MLTVLQVRSLDGVIHSLNKIRYACIINTYIFSNKNSLWIFYFAINHELRTCLYWYIYIHIVHIFSYVQSPPSREPICCAKSAFICQAPTNSQVVLVNELRDQLLGDNPVAWSGVVFFLEICRRWSQNGGIGVSGYLLVVMAFSGSSEMESNWRNFWGIFCWLVMLFFYCFIPLNCLTIPRLIWIGWFPYEIYWFYLYLRLWCFCLFLFFLEGGWGGVGGLTFFVLEFGLEGRCGGYCGCFGFQDLLSLDFQDHLRFGMTGPLKYAEQKHRSVCLDV